MVMIIAVYRRPRDLVTERNTKVPRRRSMRTNTTLPYQVDRSILLTIWRRTMETPPESSLFVLVSISLKSSFWFLAWSIRNAVVGSMLWGG